MAVINIVEFKLLDLGTFQPQPPSSLVYPRNKLVGTNIVTGDASGGNLELRFRLTQAIAQKYVFSLEELFLGSSDNTGRVFQMEIDFRDRELIGISGMRPLEVVAQTAAGFNAASQVLSRFSAAGVQQQVIPNYIFRPRTFSAATNFVEAAIIGSNVNLISLSARIWGYAWDAGQIWRGAIPVRPT